MSKQEEPTVSDKSFGGEGCIILLVCSVIAPGFSAAFVAALGAYETMGGAMLLSLFSLPSVILYLVVRSFKPRQAWRWFLVSFTPLALYFIFLIVLDPPNQDVPLRQLGIWAGAVYCVSAFVSSMVIYMVTRHGRTDNDGRTGSLRTAPTKGQLSGTDLIALKSGTHTENPKAMNGSCPDANEGLGPLGKAGQRNAKSIGEQ